MYALSVRQRPSRRPSTRPLRPLRRRPCPLHPLRHLLTLSMRPSRRRCAARGPVAALSLPAVAPAAPLALTSPRAHSHRLARPVTAPGRPGALPALAMADDALYALSVPRTSSPHRPARRRCAMPALATAHDALLAPLCPATVLAHRTIAAPARHSNSARHAFHARAIRFAFVRRRFTPPCLRRPLPQLHRPIAPL
ncbi:hypothetical protein DENSPDRAFT_846063 [Dentipellis sp. KUC8613]|nr:hypothetical protein DENSPDRAFT_846063 [Dentipellis sp. KUC8613]